MNEIAVHSPLSQLLRSRHNIIRRRVENRRNIQFLEMFIPVHRPPGHDDTVDTHRLQTKHGGDSNRAGTKNQRRLAGCDTRLNNPIPRHRQRLDQRPQLQRDIVGEDVTLGSRSGHALDHAARRV